MYELDLDAIKARAAIRPGALLAALRCVPDGEIRHGCVISDGQRTKDAIRTAYHVVHKDTPALIAEVERLREHVRILECAVDGCRISCAQWERVAQDAMLRDGLTTAEVMRIERERDEARAERDQLANRLADSVDPATIPAQQAAGWPDWHPEDYCHRCGRRNISWYTDSAVWNQVHGGSGPIWCPVCFVTAYEQTTGLRPSWRLAPADRSDETGALIRSEAAMRHERDEAIAERDRYAEVVAAAQAWREMRRATPAKPKPTAAALIAAVDRLGGDDDG